MPVGGAKRLGQLDPLSDGCPVGHLQPVAQLIGTQTQDRQLDRVEILQAAVEQQLTWLSLADKLSATALKEALSDLLLDARGKVRAWRQERRAVEAGTISPFAEYSPGSTVR